MVINVREITLPMWLFRRRNEECHYEEHNCFSNQPNHDRFISAFPVKDFHHCREDYHCSKKAKEEIKYYLAFLGFKE